MKRLLALLGAISLLTAIHSIPAAATSGCDWPSGVTPFALASEAKFLDGAPLSNTRGIAVDFRDVGSQYLVEPEAFRESWVVQSVYVTHPNGIGSGYLEFGVQREYLGSSVYRTRPFWVGAWPGGPSSLDVHYLSDFMWPGWYRWYLLNDPADNKFHMWYKDMSTNEVTTFPQALNPPWDSGRALSSIEITNQCDGESGNGIIGRHLNAWRFSGTNLAWITLGTSNPYNVGWVQYRDTTTHWNLSTASNKRDWHGYCATICWPPF